MFEYDILIDLKKLHKYLPSELGVTVQLYYEKTFSKLLFLICLDKVIYIQNIPRKKPWRVSAMA